MSHKSQLEDPLYKNWVKGGLASKYLKEGIEYMINNALANIQRKFLSDICNHLSLTEAKCTDCTTANCIPCPSKGMCNITGKGKDKTCTYHVKYDSFKEFRKCPNDICDILHTKISSIYRKGRPAWQNTDATKWCTNHWEIAKCFLPGSGYADKTSVEDTDCSGLLNLAVNCLDLQTHLDLYLAPPNGIFSQILNFRNKIFHSASLSLTTEELDEYIDLMISVLQDKKELEQDLKATNAVIKLEQLKDEGFFISTKDEEEIRQESIVKFQQEIKDDYLGRKQELQVSLCRMYEEHFKTIPISPLLDDIEADIDNVFVELVLCDDSIYNKDVKENCRQNGKNIKNYKDIFYNDKDKCKNIYVIGDAGMGKSTWCMKMLRNWVAAKTRCSKEPDHLSNPVESTQSGKIDGQQIPEKVDVFIDEENQLDKKVMAEFEIVLFVALRHAFEDGNIRDMIKNQIFEEIAHLDDLTTEVLKKEPDRCLIIVDGLDEWTRPANVKCSSLLQHPSLPGRKGLNGCTILTTTRPWKLNNIRLQSKDIDKTVKIQGIEDVGLLANKLISCKNKTRQLGVVKCERSFKMFEMEVQRAFPTNHRSSWNDMYDTDDIYDMYDMYDMYDTDDMYDMYDLHFLRVPLILIFMVCSWYDNGHLEKTMAGNFNGFMQCLFSVAEKDEYSRNKGRLLDMEGFERLKKEWSMSSKYLPRSLQEIEQFPAYSQLIIKLGKLAFDSLFTSNNVCLVFTESEIRSKLTIKELDVAVKVGILSQSKVVGKTLTHMSSLSFLHKTLQEYLAAVYLCSSADGHKEAIETYANFCLSKPYMYGTEENVRNFVTDINLSIIRELCEIKENITSESNTCALYGAVLSGTNQQTLEIKTTRLLKLCERIPTEDNDTTLTFSPQSSHYPTDQLRTVHLLRAKKMYSNELKVFKIDLLHCKHLEDVSFAHINNVQVLLNHSNLKDIQLNNVNKSDIYIMKTATSIDCHEKQFNMIFMRNLKSCKLSLGAVFWKIDMLTVIECQNLVIKIDSVIDTSVVNRHVINTVNDTINNEINTVKMELENELKIDTIILSSIWEVQNENPFFAYCPRSLIFKKCIINLESWFQIAQTTSLTCLNLISITCNDIDFAGCIRNMKQLEKLRFTLNGTRIGTSKIMSALQLLPRLEDLGLIIDRGTKDIVSEYLASMTQLKVLKLCLEYNNFDLPQQVHDVLSRSISKLNNIEKLKLKCSYTCSMNTCVTCPNTQILLHSLPHLTKLKKLHCDFYNIQCMVALSMGLPKIVDLESLYLTIDRRILDEVFYSIKHLTNLKHLKCELRHEQEIQALSKSVLTMTNLETLDITLACHDNEMLSSLQGLPRLTYLILDRELKQDNMTALLKSIHKLLNLETLSVRFACDNQSLNKNITELFSLNGHLQLVTVIDISETECGVLASNLYTAKYFSSYSLPSEDYDNNDFFDHDDDDVVIKPKPYWELKRKQEHI